MKVRRDKSGHKLCPHRKQRYYCVKCGGRGLCEHGRHRSNCPKCRNGASFCEHGKYRNLCEICSADPNRRRRKDSRNPESGTNISWPYMNRLCEHGKLRANCKKCGSHYSLLAGGFSPDQIKEIGMMECCQYPGCLVAGILNSDHIHDGSKINTENYRGEICKGHNLLLADLDRHPEWDNDESRKYKSRRPYSAIQLNGEISSLNGLKTDNL